MNIITITVVFLLSYFFTNFIIIGIDEKHRTGYDETITAAVGTLISFVIIICSIMGAMYGDHPPVFKRILEAVF